MREYVTFFKKSFKIFKKFIIVFLKDPSDCGPKTCKNGGACIEKWIENKKMCNCDFTSFTGNNCDKSN